MPDVSYLEDVTYFKEECGYYVFQRRAWILCVLKNNMDIKGFKEECGCYGF